jgi:hypothetical protein
MKEKPSVLRFGERSPQSELIQASAGGGLDPERRCGG